MTGSYANNPQRLAVCTSTIGYIVGCKDPRAGDAGVCQCIELLESNRACFCVKANLEASASRCRKCLKRPTQLPYSYASVDVMFHLMAVLLCLHAKLLATRLWLSKISAMIPSYSTNARQA